MKKTFVLIFISWLLLIAAYTGFKVVEAIGDIYQPKSYQSEDIIENIHKEVQNLKVEV